jgi:hypothetical protein
MQVKSNILGAYLIRVGRYSSTNSSRGDAAGESVEQMSDEEIHFCVAICCISIAYRVIVKRDKKHFPLQTVFLTFKVPTSAS